MISKDFCAFILTHGRAGRVYTEKALREGGYSGPIYYVVDDEDAQIEDYKQLYGAENVLVFSKDEIGKTFDKGDNFGKKGVIIFARNVCFEFAKKLGYRYFIELDDDYSSFTYRFDKELTFKERKIKSLDNVLNSMLDFLKSTPVKTVAMSQGGDYLGGGNGALGEAIRAKRKAMNSFICDVENPFTFVGCINEDVNTYVRYGQIGDIFLTLPICCLHQKATQSNKGGMTEAYLENGTYLKSFYSVMYAPSCVKINVMGENHRRIHHHINWRNCTPKILSETYKKK